MYGQGDFSLMEKDCNYQLEGEVQLPRLNQNHEVLEGMRHRGRSFLGGRRASLRGDRGMSFRGDRGMSFRGDRGMTYRGDRGMNFRGDRGMAVFWQYTKVRLNFMYRFALTILSFILK